jgi:5-methylcytosine-specific restriction endonuclease McrA
VKLERRKFAATERPHAGPRRSNTDARHIPAEVRRAVWHRDGGQCAFTSDTGHRCQERKDLQFDHIDPYARGGNATVGGMRLLCRAHNQFEAERTYGAEFMRQKRERARHSASGNERAGQIRPNRPDSRLQPTEVVGKQGAPIVSILMGVATG